MYKLTNTSTILRLLDNASIPNDEGNTDYQAYLAWVSEGNMPDPIDVPPEPTLQDRQNQAREYLNSTDWYACRLAETAVAIPDSITKARAEARLLINQV